LLLADLGIEQITDDALGFVLAFDGVGSYYLNDFRFGNRFQCSGFVAD
jgi:hypothetical protein